MRKASLRGRGKHGGTREGSGPKTSPPLPKATTPETKATAAELARPHIALAIDALVAAIKNPKTPVSARNTACKHILEAAKLEPGAAAALDTSQVSDIDLARWILSILESAATAEPATIEGEAVNDQLYQEFRH
jgi:hypothetical protein